ncbi:DUF502 domain-containing protein [Ramlibacter tataouinensis]|uniref:DUF502 domain-containing protein n=1 Tax=Ramlibacter tataouinensis (strain ATCC BAA-407 / DSM 14655 / LMG 21543 / TTB310) TaxID=365046 RepID=F5XWT3_RAMTT|nr:DUF502 domain-containing protein [Ramlibacter tataouinensis]AEG94227.1 conserved hypothetical protein [Ramlibacter tataouinensis TTB310]
MAPLRKWLFAGLLVIVPLAITVWVLEWIISTLDQTLLILPAAWQPDRLIGYHVPGLGVLLALAILLAVGAITSNIVGRRLVEWGDAILNRIPVVRSIYSSVKQVSDTLFSPSGNAFRTAVLVQWPRPDVWTIGFVTGTPGGDVTNHLQGEYLSVYVPTTPNPTGGYFVMLRRTDCIELRMTVDEALRYVISMGVVVPGGPVNNLLK